MVALYFSNLNMFFYGQLCSEGFNTYNQTSGSQLWIKGDATAGKQLDAANWPGADLLWLVEMSTPSNRTRCIKWQGFY